MRIGELTAGELPPHTQQRLVVIVVLLGVLTIVHDLDHVRQGRALPGVLYLVAVAALVAIATTLFVLVRYPRWARAAAAVHGAATVVGVGIVHVAPEWSSSADSYSAAGADVLSWSIILAMMLAGVLMVVVATRSGG